MADPVSMSDDEDPSRESSIPLRPPSSTDEQQTRRVVEIRRMDSVASDRSEESAVSTAGKFLLCCCEIKTCIFSKWPKCYNYA
jgi:hypothetical protein